MRPCPVLTRPALTAVAEARTVAACADATALKRLCCRGPFTALATAASAAAFGAVTTVAATAARCCHHHLRYHHRRCLTLSPSPPPPPPPPPPPLPPQSAAGVRRAGGGGGGAARGGRLPGHQGRLRGVRAAGDAPARLRRRAHAPPLLRHPLLLRGPRGELPCTHPPAFCHKRHVEFGTEVCGARGRVRACMRASAGVRRRRCCERGQAVGAARPTRTRPLPPLLLLCR
jgi:hypothetical protein